MTVLYRLSISAGVFFSTLSFAEPQKVLFAVFGGYESCSKSSRSDLPPLGIGMHPPFEDVRSEVQTLHRGMAIITLSACLYSSAPPGGEGRYVVSDQPGKLKYGDTDVIRGEIERIVSAHPGIEVFLAGHSYGAWMTMYIAEKLAGKINLKGLFTIDPIGPACGPAGVIFGDPACHSAPTDRDNKKIAKSAGIWANFYQDEDNWLSSSSIAEATENNHITYYWGPHSDIDSDDSVWNRIGEAVKTALTP